MVWITGHVVLGAPQKGSFWGGLQTPNLVCIIGDGQNGLFGGFPRPPKKGEFPLYALLTMDNGDIENTPKMAYFRVPLYLQWSMEESRGIWGVKSLFLGVKTGHFKRGCPKMTPFLDPILKGQNPSYSYMERWTQNGLFLGPKWTKKGPFRVPSLGEDIPLGAKYPL